MAVPTRIGDFAYGVNTFRGSVGSINAAARELGGLGRLGRTGRAPGNQEGIIEKTNRRNAAWFARDHLAVSAWINRTNFIGDDVEAIQPPVATAAIRP